MMVFGGQRAIGELKYLCEMLLIWGLCSRIESHGADYKLVGISVYGAGGVVGGGKGYIKRLVWLLTV